MFHEDCSTHYVLPPAGTLYNLALDKRKKVLSTLVQWIRLIITASRCIAGTVALRPFSHALNLARD